MQYVIVLLIIIIILLVSYLFLVKRDLRRISKDIKTISKSDSNSLISSELAMNELSELILEINNLLNSTRKARIEYKEKSGKLNKMIMNISHDLRTPLTSALGYVDIILKSNIGKKEREELLIVEDRLKRLEELICSFFEFSKIMGYDEVTLERVNLVSLLEKSIGNYYDDFSLDNRMIILNRNNNKIELLSDKTKLDRIIDNLIGNAYKHSESDLTINLKVSDVVKLEFINDLLDEKVDVEHIFDEFYTIDISRTKGNTGLGLSIAKYYTNLLGGMISAKKSKGKLIITLKFKI